MSGSKAKVQACVQWPSGFSDIEQLWLELKWELSQDLYNLLASKWHGHTYACAE